MEIEIKIKKDEEHLFELLKLNDILKDMRFTKKAIALFNLISEKVYEERKSKHIENSNLV